MNVLVNPDGTRNRDYRPYIDQEEFKRNVVLYDPNGYNIDTGLYARTEPGCQRWVDHFHQDQLRTHRRPYERIDADGRANILYRRQ